MSQRYGWSCDFETAVLPDKTYVWLWGAVSIDDNLDFVYGKNIWDFMEWMLNKKKLYFHNLKFDGFFIVDWLLNNGWIHTTGKLANGEFRTLISRSGVWYQIQIKYKGKIITIVDSLKKLPMSVSAVAESFQLGETKGKIDYEAFRSEDHVPTEDELDYLKRDCMIIAKALKIQLDQGLKKITNSADAMNFYKQIVGDDYKYLFPILDSETDTLVRRSYKGGWTYLHRPGDYGKCVCYDVNGLYSAAMTMDLPYGDPVYFEGEYRKNEAYPLYTTRFYADFKLKKDHLPTLQLKGNRFIETEYVKDSR